MREQLLSDLKLYEAEISEANKRLAELSDKRNELIAHGRRIEGIVSYIRAKLDALHKASADTPGPTVNPGPETKPA